MSERDPRAQQARTAEDAYADELLRQVNDYGTDAPDEDPHDAYAKAALRAGAAALRAPSPVQETCVTCASFDSHEAGSRWQHGWCQRHAWACPAQPFGCSSFSALSSSPVQAPQREDEQEAE